MIVPSHIPNPYVKPKWQASVGIMESVVAYNCRTHGFPIPICAWPMWEGAGNTALDLSGNGNHGEFNGAKWAGSERGACVIFDGTDDFVEVANESKFDFGTEDWTLSCRFKSGIDHDGTLVGKGVDGAGGIRYKLKIDVSGSVMVEIDDNGVGIGKANVTSTATTYGDDGIWHHVVGAKDGNNLRLYIDGTEDGASPADITGMASLNTNYPVIVGKIYNDAGIDFYQFFNGLIDDLPIFDTALSTTQIKFLSENPYFMYQIPEELYGYVSAAPPTGNPFWYYEMIKRRNQ